MLAQCGQYRAARPGMPQQRRGGPVCVAGRLNSGSKTRSKQILKPVRAAGASDLDKEPGDVYEALEPQPLKEGVEKHVVSVFVADESGIINRVAGVFARRGVNIESLAVGLNVDKALFTIVVNGSRSTMLNLVKQLSKLVKVQYVEDVTFSKRIERELLMVKLRAPPGPARTEVLQLADIFGSRVLDVSERTLTLGITGDAGKTVAMQKAMLKFGVMEVARTGRIVLKRGEDLLEMGSGWGDSVMRQMQQRRQSLPELRRVVQDPEDKSPDVYAVGSPKEGVWNNRNILDTYTAGSTLEYEPHTLSIEVDDIPGVLNEVTGVFARRGYNVQSLAVGSSEKPGRSRITMVVPGNQEVANLLKQLLKLPVVVRVTDLTGKPMVVRELMLIKVRCTASQRSELQVLRDIFDAKIVDVGRTCMTMELMAQEDRMRAFQEILEPYGIMEVALTGRVALARGSGVDTKYLERTYLTNWDRKPE